MCGGAARSGDRGSGKQSRKIQDVHAVSEIAGFHLKIKAAAFFLVEFHAGGSTQGKIWTHSSAIEIHARQDFRSVLRQQKIHVDGGRVDFSGQAAAIVPAEGGPYALCDLGANAGADGVALVLRDRGFAVVGENSAGIASNEQSTGDRALRDCGLV